MEDEMNDCHCFDESPRSAGRSLSWAALVWLLLWFDIARAPKRLPAQLGHFLLYDDAFQQQFS
eukprot:765715-Pleurochrysis_carterae.AAC.1